MYVYLKKEIESLKSAAYRYLRQVIPERSVIHPIEASCHMCAACVRYVYIHGNLVGAVGEITWLDP